MSDARDAGHPEIRLALAAHDPYIGIVQRSPPVEETTMTPAFFNSASTFSASSISTAELFRRIDEMPMSVYDRERAKAMLQKAERIADGLASIVTGLRAVASRIALPTTRRSTLRNSPAPR